MSFACTSLRKMRSSLIVFSSSWRTFLSSASVSCLGGGVGAKGNTSKTQFFSDQEKKFSIIMLVETKNNYILFINFNRFGNKVKLKATDTRFSLDLAGLGGLTASPRKRSLKKALLSSDVGSAT